MPLDLTSFAIKWQQTELSEKSAYQQHFRDLCEALGVPHPTEEDVSGDSYTFEKHVEKVGKGGSGFADVWKRDAFAWEYKKPGGDLNAAYRQLNEYHEALENPPLLIVCDFKRFEVHTKFESQPSRTYSFTLEELRVNREIPTSALLPQDVLRYVFGDRNKLRPNAVTERVTRDAATDLLKLARQLELERATDPNPPSKEKIAHFLLRIVFCLFADSIGLIPNNIFRNLVVSSRESRINFNKKLSILFGAMSSEGSFFGADDIPWFNGGLFNGAEIIELNNADCDILRQAAKRDWSQIEPSIFGTLFERSLDASKRSMIGAHYTSPEDILLLVEPVVMVPLLRQWESTKAAVLEALAAEEEGQSQRRALRANRPANLLLTEWASELQKVRILDPACGSGNFLYIAMKQLLDLWQKAREFALQNGLNLPVESMPTPAQLFGIEIDFYAHEIASAVVWIGLLQWKRDNGYNDQPRPILRKLDNIELADAILRYDEAGKAYEPAWPPAEFIVGNPPFLGDKKMRANLNTALRPSYVDDLRRTYEGVIPGGADLVTYWFEKGRTAAWENATRVGLIATNSIRQGANREVLKRVENSGGIFMAWSDKPWLLAGAAVRVSLVGFDNGSEQTKTLDGVLVSTIHADLSSQENFVGAEELSENAGLCFLGMMKGGAFDIDSEVARKMIAAPANPNGRPNSDVIRPRLLGRDILRRPSKGWVIDFTGKSLEEAAFYEMPFEYIRKKVKAKREANDDASMKKSWWLFGRSRPALRKAITNMARCIVTSEIAKHRLFVWMDTKIVPDHRLHVFARDDDYFFGVLQSKPHVDWALRLGSTFEDRPSYNSDTIFLTFPFPWPPGKEPSEADSPIVRAIAEAARDLVRLRDAWLNPPGASDDDLKTRTLTKLYNARPEWLANAHRTLDEAVFAAYGWPANLPDQEILARLLALNHARAAQQGV